MKGVLIKDYDMPRSCDECPCFGASDIGEEYCFCAVKGESFTDEDFTQDSRRAKWCPLVEVDSAWFSHHPQGNIYSKLP